MYDAFHGGMPRAIIETFVRQKLTQLKSDPERCARNLVDMALDFSEGRFQKYFFHLAQAMLKNRQSSYYSIIEDIAANVDTERLLTFGMNVGYNSLTYGAKRIRELEAAQGFNIPWTVILYLDSDKFNMQSQTVNSLICQGKELGIYTWFIFTKGRPDAMLEAVAQNPDAAFVVLADAHELDDTFIESAGKCHNLMLSVGCDSDTVAVCDKLHSQKLLYSIYTDIRRDSRDTISELIEYKASECLHTPFLLFLGSAPDSESEYYRKICEVREGHHIKTVPFDIYEDIRYIDGVISEDSCLTIFDADGNLLRPDRTPDPQYNYNTKNLQDILSACLKK